jgi:phospholipase C
MSPVNRRQFLQLTAGATAASVLTPSIARAASIPAARRTGTLRDIEHIVVLMQENRSFDHYFGSLRGVRGFGDPNPVTLPSGKSVWHQDDLLPFRPDADELGLQFIQDLAHGWNDGHQAFNNGRYDQWVQAKSPTTMAYLTRADIPFHYALADAFTICDAYHCSLLGPTDPNRYYMWTGWAGNDGKGGGPVVTNAELGYGWTTYPERLEKAGVSWKVYQDAGIGLDAAGSWGWTQDPYIGNYGDNALLYFDQYRTALPGSPLFEKARRGTSGSDFFGPLRADVLGGRLPQVSWIVAPEAYTEHPNWPANYGAWYVAQVLDALTADPDVWARTALLITYDENDGLFDHVVPPYPSHSTVDTALERHAAEGGNIAGHYGLGVRVPMLVVSPWSTGGYVNSEVFDHTSIIRFIERRFGVHEPNITPWRRAVCGDLTTAFDFGFARASVPALPPTSGYAPPDRVRHPDYVPAPPADPALPSPEPGVRPARALPYDLAADGTVSGGKLRIDFASMGRAGAAFYVTSSAGDPQSYTVGAGHHLSGTFPLDADITVHGPNGFVRAFHGAGVDVTARRDARHALRLSLHNPGKHPVRLVIGAQTVRLRAGERATHTVETHHGWYDVTITGDASYRRRLAGHVETGAPSTSEPPSHR